jgi:hypothetical protein
LPETIPPEAPEGDRARSPREEMMDRIAAHAQEQRELEMRHGDVMDADARTAHLTFDTQDGNRDFGVNVADAAGVETTPAQPSVPPSTDQPGRAPTQPVQPAPDLFLVDVGGQQLNVSKEQLIQLARMGMIANQTVSDYQRQQQWQPQAPVQTPAPEPPPPVNRDKVRDVVKRLQYSSEDDATESLAGLIGDVVSQNRPSAPPIDQRAWINQASQETLRAIEAQRVVSTIRDEYPDIVGNVDFSHMAHMKAQQIRQELVSLGRQATDLEIFREAGNRVRSLFNLSRPSETQPPSGSEPPASQASNIRVQPRPNVDARKREAPRSTSSVLDTRVATQSQPRAPTAAELVEKMRQQRGQSPMR